MRRSPQPLLRGPIQDANRASEFVRRSIQQPVPVHPNDGIGIAQLLDRMRGGGVLPLGGTSWEMLKPIRILRVIGFSGQVSLLSAEPWTALSLRVFDNLADPLIEVNRNGTTIKGFHLAHIGQSGRTVSGPAIYVHDCNDILIEDCTFGAVRTAIKLVNCLRVRLRGLTFTVAPTHDAFQFQTVISASMTGCLVIESTGGNEVVLDAGCQRVVIAGNDLGVTGVISGASLGLGNRPVLGDTSLNVCGSVT